MHALVTGSVEAGARLAAGGTYEGLFYQPTVLADVAPAMPAYASEVFGPVAPVIRFATADEAAKLAADSEYGLSLGILTRDVMRGLELARQIPTGIVHINDQTVDDAPNTPFGGIRASGTGARFGGTRQPGRVHRHPLGDDPRRHRAVPVLSRRPANGTMRTRTQVGIVGAGPAGLLLSHLLALRGIDSVLVEIRSREYCEARQRAGVLEDGSVALLREAGLADRLDRQGLEHGGIYLQFAGERRHIDFRDLTGGRTVTVYAQTEVVKDLIARRLADGGAARSSSASPAPRWLTWTPTSRCSVTPTPDGDRREVICDAIAGCDGFHGICRPRSPPGC